MHGNKWLMGTAVSLSLGAAVFAVCDDDGKAARSEYRVWTSSSSGDEDEHVVQFSDSQSIELSIENGKVKVARINGEELDEDRVQVKDGRIILLNEDGEPIEFGRIGISGDGDGAFGKLAIEFTKDVDAFGDAMNAWRFGTATAAPGVMLGVHMSDTGPALVKHLRLVPGATTLVDSVYPDLPAAAAGVGEYDIIVEVDGDTPADPESVRKALAEKEPGDTVSLRLISGGDDKEVTVELVEYDATRMPFDVLFDAEIERLPFGTMRRSFMFAPDAELNEIFVTPQWRLGTDDDATGRILELKGQDRFEFDSDARVDLDSRIQRLTERMAELEALLQKVIDEVR